MVAFWLVLGSWTCLGRICKGPGLAHGPTPTSLLPSIFTLQEESNGRVQVLDGAMACPPEDSKGLEGMGPRSYQVRSLVID